MTAICRAQPSTGNAILIRYAINVLSNTELPEEDHQASDKLQRSSCHPRLCLCSVGRQMRWTVFVPVLCAIRLGRSEHGNRTRVRTKAPPPPKTSLRKRAQCDHVQTLWCELNLKPTTRPSVDLLIDQELERIHS